MAKLEDLLKKPLSEDYLPDEFKHEEANATDLPGDVSRDDVALGYIAPAMVDTVNKMAGLGPSAPVPFRPEDQIEKANDIVEADNAPKEESKSTPERSPAKVEESKSSEKVDPRQALLDQYKKLMEERQGSVDEARERDADTDFMANILKSGSLLNKALASQGGYKVDPGQVVTPKSDFERQMKEDYKTRLENLMAQAKLSGKKSLSDLDKAKLETEKLKQDKLRSEKSRKDQELDIKKAKESRAKEEADRETKEIIGQADDKINRIDEIKKKLKKGGVTGIFDAYIAGPIDYALGGDDYQTRKELQDLVVDQTLLKTAQTKGAISDAEMALFKSGIPSMGAQEEVWSDWLDKVKQAQQNIKNRLQKGEAAPVVREVRRRTKEGKTAIFDADTKQFLRYEE